MLKLELREELTDEERVGVVNWDEFSKIAMTDITGYAEDLKFQRKLISWIQYHIRKGDILFKETKWVWNSTRLHKYGRFRKKIVPRKAVV